jgi:hypothetical protein
MAEKFLDDAGLLHLIAALNQQSVQYSPPTSGPLAGMTLTQAMAYISQLLGGVHKDLTIDVNAIKVVIP